jgi:hypothetical protein
MERQLAANETSAGLEVKGTKVFEALNVITLIVVGVKMFFMLVLLCEGAFKWWQKKDKNKQALLICGLLLFTVGMVSLDCNV